MKLACPAGKNGISHKRFCERMGLNRTTKYYKAQGERESNKHIVELMTKYYTSHPTAGVITMVNMLRLKGIIANHKRVRRLMKQAGLKAIYPKRQLSKDGNPKYVHPYLLRGVEITRPNHVWSTDISYIPTAGGFMYLYVVIDVYSRYVVGWRLSNTLSASNCTDLVNECVARYGKPEIINSDQGTQYTSRKWETTLTGHGILISMDGRGRCKDNIWIERFWRSVKQEYVYVSPADSVEELRKGIANYIAYYNNERPHQSLDVLLPSVKYGVRSEK